MQIRYAHTACLVPVHYPPLDSATDDVVQLPTHIVSSKIIMYFLLMVVQYYAVFGVRVKIIV
jgi:hypothetical protein